MRMGTCAAVSDLTTCKRYQALVLDYHKLSQPMNRQALHTLKPSHQRNLNSEFVMLWIIALVHDENRDTLQFHCCMAWSKVSIHSLLSLPLEKASTWLLWFQLTRGPVGMGDGPGRQRTLWSRFGWYLDQSCQGLSGFGAQSRQCRWTCWFSVANWRASYQPMNAATK